MRVQNVLLLSTFLVTAGLCGARAEEPTLYVAGAGGSEEQALRKDVFPAFEKQAHVHVAYVAGNSTDVLARLVAQKGHEQIDVAMIDDGPMYQATALGYCRSLAAAPVYDDLYDLAKYPGGMSVAFAVLGAGLVYNTKMFADQHWPAPTSWTDLEAPHFKGKVVIPPLNNTYGLLTLVEFAKLNGGSEENIDPGFTAIKQKVDPNVLAYEPSPGKMTELFQTGQAAIAVWGSSRAKALAATGFTAGFVYPKEGGLAISVGVCPVAGGENKPAAQAFIQYLLSPPAQVAMAKGAGFGPVNRKAELDAADRIGLPYGAAEVAQLKTIDWNTANAEREKWNQRWVREIEH
jgi:putative spermidine/putrescine transport system substrate-binding protein